MSADQAGRRPWNIRRARVVAFFVLVALLLGLGLLNQAPAGATGNIEQIQDHEPDVDFRTGSVDATAAQRSAVSQLGATARWNQFGTPKSMINQGGFLGTVQGSGARAAARKFLANNAAVFGLSADYLRDDSRLQFVNDAPMEDSNGHAVFFRQRFGELAAVKDGSVTVGLTGTASAGWKVAYVSSSLTKDTTIAGNAALTEEDAWLAAANALGEGGYTAAQITSAREDVSKDPDNDLRSDFTLLTVAGLPQEQRVRLTAIPTPTEGVIPAYEAIFLNDQGGVAEAFTSYVDANSGKVLFRANNVQQLARVDPLPEPPGAQPFTGTYTAQQCGENGPFTAPEGTKSIAVFANATVPANDIVLQLLRGGVVVAQSDTLTTPEAILYEGERGDNTNLAGDYLVRVCNFQGAEVIQPNTYTGFFLTNSAEDTPDGVPYPPEWKYFYANPPIGTTILNYPSTDTRKVTCWNKIDGNATPPGCNYDAANRVSRFPWDVNTKAAGSPPSFTTVGNNARAAESWYGALSPGPTGYRPVDEEREYNYEWTNDWHTSRNPADEGKGCDPQELTVPGESNDISAAVASLFAAHNRMHDWSYNLGFTEQAYNLQESNFGTTQPDRENDPELGDVQAGAVSGGPPSYLGRDNANQITLADGIPPITNMYLWQPIAAAFYPPCVDGDYDMSVIAHEYGHAIQNRMVAGPDEGLSGLQASSLGESWSDLTAIEYLYDFGYELGGGANRYAVGPYVTGNKQKGIRNYGMNESPLNYSNIEYDPNGVTSPHADGEIWSATNFDIRQLLMKKYGARGFDSAPGTILQRRCAEGKRPPSDCPGNRRWAQTFHDAFLLLPSSIDFLDARDAYLAADRMRYGDSNSNQRELWLAFARRGMGEGASSRGSDDRDPVPSFASPLEDDARITFKPVTGDGAAVRNFKVYVGDYEARTVPVAKTGSTTARFAPGTYEFVVQAPGYGLRRYEQTFEAGQAETVGIAMQPNWASLAEGAKTTASGDASSGRGGSSAFQLIDETEETNWRADGPVKDKQVTVNLVGGRHSVERVNVSAFLRPQDEGDKFGDTDTQNRFSALRKFEILTCTVTEANDCSNPNGGFDTVYTSPTTSKRGPASADVPRPLAPNLSFQGFDVRDTSATHVQLRVVSSQCTGGPAYQGDPDADPTNQSDCGKDSEEDEVVRAAELEVFGD
jgi:extracellular elastinolytic metalloproteinase